jgi:hypothetical protein
MRKSKKKFDAPNAVSLESAIVYWARDVSAGDGAILSDPTSSTHGFAAA